MGCLIELPEREELENPTKACRLPPTRKDTALLNFKGHIFFEEKEEVEEAVKELRPLPGSKVLLLGVFPKSILPLLDYLFQKREMLWSRLRKSL